MAYTSFKAWTYNLLHSLKKQIMRVMNFLECRNIFIVFTQEIVNEKYVFS